MNTFFTVLFVMGGVISGVMTIVYSGLLIAHMRENWIESRRVRVDPVRVPPTEEERAAFERHLQEMIASGKWSVSVPRDRSWYIARWTG